MLRRRVLGAHVDVDDGDGVAQRSGFEADAYGATVVILVEMEHVDATGHCRIAPGPPGGGHLSAVEAFDLNPAVAAFVGVVDGALGVGLMRSAGGFDDLESGGNGEVCDGGTALGV